MRISDWSSDVCSSDLRVGMGADIASEGMRLLDRRLHLARRELHAVERIEGRGDAPRHHDLHVVAALAHLLADRLAHLGGPVGDPHCEGQGVRSEEHTSELQSLMRLSYAGFCLKKKKKTK